jgi:hypothetical protein
MSCINPNDDHWISIPFNAIIQHTYTQYKGHCWAVSTVCVDWWRIQGWVRHVPQSSRSKDFTDALMPVHCWRLEWGWQEGLEVTDLAQVQVLPVLGCLCLFYFLVELGFELRALCLQSRCSTTWVTSSVHVCSGYFGDEGSHELFAWELWFSWSQPPK